MGFKVYRLTSFACGVRFNLSHVFKLFDCHRDCLLGSSVKINFRLFLGIDLVCKTNKCDKQISLCMTKYVKTGLSTVKLCFNFISQVQRICKRDSSCFVK